MIRRDIDETASVVLGSRYMEICDIELPGAAYPYMRAYVVLEKRTQQKAKDKAYDRADRSGQISRNQRNNETR